MVRRHAYGVNLADQFGCECKIYICRVCHHICAIDCDLHGKDAKCYEDLPVITNVTWEEDYRALTGKGVED